VTPRNRVTVAALVLLALLSATVLLAFAGRACPGQISGQDCPDAAFNRAVVVGLGSVGVALAVTPFAFLGEFGVRRRIVYRGAWIRAVRRGLLAGGGLAALAGLRLGGALSVPAALFVVSLMAAAEWVAVRRFDGR
jgi:hypothetical protein